MQAHADLEQRGVAWGLQQLGAAAAAVIQQRFPAVLQPVASGTSGAAVTAAVSSAFTAVLGASDQQHLLATLMALATPAVRQAFSVAWDPAAQEQARHLSAEPEFYCLARLLEDAACPTQVSEGPRISRGNA